MFKERKDTITTMGSDGNTGLNMSVKSSINDLMNNTPLYRLRNIEKKLNLKARLYLKLENYNPLGSIKDRATLYMIERAIEKGLINDDTTLLEATSGNTGIALAGICASKKLKCVIAMPESFSIERLKLLKQLGCRVVLTAKEKGMEGAIEFINKLSKEIDNSFILNQFENEDNLLCHYYLTSKEIIDDLDKKVDIFVSGIGSGGTIMGCSKRFKDDGLNTFVIGIEPEEASVISSNKRGIHKIQGIGAGFIPKLIDLAYIDKIETVKYSECIEACKLLAKEEGILAGISSGANLSVALKYASLESNREKNIVSIVVDSAFKYLSSDLFE